jgi:hypothetical protein
LFCGVHIVRPSSAADDLLRRAALFQQVLEVMGLSDQISVFLDGEVLRIKAVHPWKLEYPSARLDGGNPLGFYVCGFETIDDALAVSDCLIARFAKKTLAVGFVTRQAGPSYNAVYQRLNEHWGPWEITIIGSLTQVSLDILQGGELPENPPTRIPAFHFYGGGMGSGGFGSVLIENGKRYLELATATEDVPLEVLKEWVCYFPDARFQLLSD